MEDSSKTVHYYNSAPDISDVLGKMTLEQLQGFLQYCATNAYTVTRSRISAWLERNCVAT